MDLKISTEPDIRPLKEILDEIYEIARQSAYSTESLNSMLLPKRSEMTKIKEEKTMRALKDELLIWAAMIAGAVIEGLIIVAFVTGFVEGDIPRIWALCVGFICLGIVPQVWALEQVDFFGDKQ